MTTHHNNEPTSQTATSRENGLGDFSSAVAERAGSYSAQPIFCRKIGHIFARKPHRQKCAVVGTRHCGAMESGDDPSNEPVQLVSAEFLLTHWVWVAGVDEGKTDKSGQDCSKVAYTETGTPFYTGEEADMWPESGTYLPWHDKKMSFASGQYGSKAVSTTCMVWNWKQYSWDGSKIENGETVYYYNNCEDWTSSGTSPSIYTRYYDGSP